MIHPQFTYNIGIYVMTGILGAMSRGRMSIANHAAIHHMTSNFLRFDNNSVPFVVILGHHCDMRVIDTGSVLSFYF